MKKKRDLSLLEAAIGAAELVVFLNLHIQILHHLLVLALLNVQRRSALDAFAQA